MDQGNAALGLVSILLRFVLIVVALYILYVIYQFLFGGNQYNSYIILSGVNNANGKGVTRSNKDAPFLVHGGEYSVSMWVYISDWNIKSGVNKHLFSVGGPNESTVTVYLGKYQNSLHVRTHTVEGNDIKKTGKSNLYEAIFANTTIAGDDPNVPCDINNIDLQKWVCVSVAINAKTVDVYIDGKLARSCVAPRVPLVSTPDNYTISIAEKGGFGGYVSNVIVYDYALNPEQVWRIYMSGPGPQLGFLDYFKALFNPRSIGTLTYPKYPA